MPLAALLGSHQKVVNMSKNALASNTQSICTLNQQCTGWGIDAVTGPNTITRCFYVLTLLFTFWFLAILSHYSHRFVCIVQVLQRQQQLSR